MIKGVIVSICFVTVWLINGCAPQLKGARGSSTIIENSENIVSEATLLRIATKEGYRIMEVVNPWDTTKLFQRYILIDREATIPENLPVGEIIRTPVDKLIAFTAIDIGSLAALGALDKVVGVCEAEYIQSKSIQEGISSGKIADLGSYLSPNIERLLSSDAETIIATPYEGRNYGAITEVGITISECASYLENTPLGRAEWIRFYGELLGYHSKADSIYNSTANRYNSVARMIKESINRTPKLLPEKRYGQAWFVAAGDSYKAMLYRAAGANYPWSSDRSGTTISLSFEEVYTKAHDADVWIFGYCKEQGDMTLAELSSEHPSYSEFKAFKEGEVYASNTQNVPFYEESPLRPDLLLMDIAKILHPEQFKEHTFRYYKRLNKE